MPVITRKEDIQKILNDILVEMQKKGMITLNDQFNLIEVLSTCIAKAGGLNPNDPKMVEKLRQGIITTLTSLKLHPEFNTEIKELMTLSFKDEKKLSPDDKRKLTLGTAYIIALQTNPKLEIDMKLIFKDKLTPKELEKLDKDLDKVFKVLNDRSDLKLDPNDLAKLVKALKEEIKNPGSLKNKLDPKHEEADKELIALFQNLYGGGRGPLLGNLAGVAFAGVAVGVSPMNMYTGSIISEAVNAFVKTNALSRDAVMSEDELDDYRAFLFNPDADMELPKEASFDSLLDSVVSSFLNENPNPLPADELDAPKEKGKLDISAPKKESTSLDTDGVPDKEPEPEPEQEHLSPFKNKPTPPWVQ